MNEERGYEVGHSVSGLALQVYVAQVLLLDLYDEVVHVEQVHRYFAADEMLINVELKLSEDTYVAKLCITGADNAIMKGIAVNRKIWKNDILRIADGAN
jgi:hypothetical protein